MGQGVGEEGIISLLLQPASTLPQIILTGMFSQVAERGCCRPCSMQCVFLSCVMLQIAEQFCRAVLKSAVGH